MPELLSDEELNKLTAEELIRYAKRLPPEQRFDLIDKCADNYTGNDRKVVIFDMMRTIYGFEDKKLDVLKKYGDDYSLKELLVSYYHNPIYYDVWNYDYDMPIVDRIEKKMDKEEFIAILFYVHEPYLFKRVLEESSKFLTTDELIEHISMPLLSNEFFPKVKDTLKDYINRLGKNESRKFIISLLNSIGYYSMPSFMDKLIEENADILEIEDVCDICGEQLPSNLSELKLDSVDIITFSHLINSINTYSVRSFVLDKVLLANANSFEEQEKYILVYAGSLLGNYNTYKNYTDIFKYYVIDRYKDIFDNQKYSDKSKHDYKSQFLCDLIDIIESEDEDGGNYLYLPDDIFRAYHSEMSDEFKIKFLLKYMHSYPIACSLDKFDYYISFFEKDESKKKFVFSYFDAYEDILHVSGRINPDYAEKVIEQYFHKEKNGRYIASVIKNVVTWGKYDLISKYDNELSFEDLLYIYDISYMEEGAAKGMSEEVVANLLCVLPTTVQFKAIKKLKNNYDGIEKTKYIISELLRLSTINTTMVAYNIKYYINELSLATPDFLASFASYICNMGLSDMIIETLSNIYEGEKKAEFISKVYKDLKCKNPNLLFKYADEFEYETRKRFLLEATYDYGISPKPIEYAEEMGIQLDLRDVLYLCGIPKNAEIPNNIDAYSIIRLFNDYMQYQPEMLASFSKYFLKKATQEEKIAYLTDVLEYYPSIDRDEYAKAFAKTYFVPGFEDELNRTLKKAKYVLSEGELAEYMPLITFNQLANNVGKDSYKHTAELMQQLDSKLQEKNTTIRNMIHDLDMEIKSKCSVDLCNHLLQVNDLENAQKRDSVSYEYINQNGEKQEKKIQVYDITDMKYFMFVHTINGYSSGINTSSNFYQEWNNTSLDKGTSTISTPPNDEKFSGHVVGSPVICFFNNINPESIVHMGNKDIYITHATNATVPESYYGGNYFLKEDLMRNIFYGYGEIGLFRERQEFDAIGEVGQNMRINPSAVICYDEEPDELSKKCAADFGIPILYVNTDIQAGRRRKELDERIHNPDTYKDFKNVERLVDDLTSFACGLQWKDSEDNEYYGFEEGSKQAQLINTNAFSQIMMEAENEMMKELKNATDIRKESSTELTKKMELIDKLSQKIEEVEKRHTDVYTAYESIDAEEIASKIHEVYKSTMPKISTVNFIRYTIQVQENYDLAYKTIKACSEQFNGEELDSLFQFCKISEINKNYFDIPETTDSVSYRMSDTSSIVQQVQMSEINGYVDKEELAHHQRAVNDMEEYKNSKAHSSGHIDRVMLFADIISNMEDIDPREKELVLEAAKYHDIGRKTDNKEDHGTNSARIAREKLSKSGYDSKEIDIICTAIEAHDKENDEQLESLIQKYGADEELLGTYEVVSSILKDADALDRTRFTNRRAKLKPEYLRTGSSKKLIAYSYQIQDKFAEEQLGKMGITTSQYESPIVRLHEERAKRHAKKCVGDNVPKGNNQKARRELKKYLSHEHEYRG